MGDPRKIRSKYSKPGHPWQKARIDEEKGLKRTYAFKNKKEMWRMNSKLKKVQAHAKKLNAQRGPQAERETQELLKRLTKLGLLTDNVSLSAVLGLTVENVNDRRLQSVVHRNNLANSMKQARQFITHRHIAISGTPVTSPSHLVTLEEEGALSFVGKSPFNDDMHPERMTGDQRKEAAALRDAAEKAAAEQAEKNAEAEKAKSEAPAEEKEAPAEEKVPAEATEEKPAEEKKAPAEATEEKPAEEKEAATEEKPAEDNAIPKEEVPPPEPKEEQTE